MAKWCGVIGFAETVEDGIDEWVGAIVERQYIGDVLDTKWRRHSGNEANDEITLSNTISIVSDPYAVNHCATMKYVEYGGAKWNISDIDIASPRINLTLGGVYNVG